MRALKLYNTKLNPNPAGPLDNAPKQEAKKPKEAEPVVETTKVEPVSQDPISDAFKNRPSAPTYNTGAERQDKASMDAQAIGNLLALLGDVGGVALGAPVQKRASKPLEPYMQSIQRRKEKFEKDKQIFDKEDWLLRLKQAQGQSASEIAAEEKQYKRSRDTVSDLKATKDLGLKERGADLSETKVGVGMVEKKRDRASREKIAGIQAKSRAAIAAANRSTKAKKDMTAVVVDVDGKEIAFKEGEKGKYLEDALSWIETNPEAGIADLEYLFKVQPDKANEQLVRRYIMDRSEKDPKFKEFIIQKEDGIKDYEEFVKTKFYNDKAIEEVSQPSNKWGKYVRN